MTKLHILQEIKKIALANGGKAFGKDKFYNETGIKQSDWYGKYWTRWGDAISEAGFSPNEMQVGYEDDFLIEKLVALAREVGHFPLYGELRMKAFNDKGFPSHTTFDINLGDKGSRISKVAEYCRKKAGLEDVLHMCEEASPKNNKASDRKAEASEKIGIVYLIKSGRFYKIGKTNSIGRREYDLGILLPEKLTTIHIIETDDPDGIEAYWHRRFAAKRKGGEWFDLSASDITAFKRWRKIV